MLSSNKKIDTLLNQYIQKRIELIELDRQIYEEVEAEYAQITTTNE